MLYLFVLFTRVNLIAFVKRLRIKQYIGIKIYLGCTEYFYKSERRTKSYHINFKYYFFLVHFVAEAGLKQLSNIWNDCRLIFHAHIHLHVLHDPLRVHLQSLHHDLPHSLLHDLLHDHHGHHHLLCQRR